MLKMTEELQRSEKKEGGSCSSPTIRDGRINILIVANNFYI